MCDGNDRRPGSHLRARPSRSPWAAALAGPSEANGDQMLAAMDAVGVDGALLTYERYVEAFRVTDRLSDGDRATLIGGSLKTIYG